MFKIDKNRYKITINGIAANIKKNNNIIAPIIKIVLKIFKRECMASPLLNFKEIKGILITKRIGRIIEIAVKNWMVLKKGYVISGKEAINKAATGVGNPIKEVAWHLSILNFDKRIAEKTGNRNPKIAGNKLGSLTFDWKNTSTWT